MYPTFAMKNSLLHSETKDCNTFSDRTIQPAKTNHQKPRTNDHCLAIECFNRQSYTALVHFH
jgi:hypothetical protein